jgi:hypothetical protein
MKMHANARLSLKGRELLIERVECAGWSVIAAAWRRAGVARSVVVRQVAPGGRHCARGSAVFRGVVCAA